MKFSELSKEELVNLNSGKGLGSGKNKGGGGRKEEVLNLLKGGMYSVKELSGIVGVSNRNISSVICYLRDDGIILKEFGGRVVLWGKIVNGVKEGNRIVKGSEGVEIRFDFEKGCFKDEIKEEVKGSKK